MQHLQLLSLAVYCDPVPALHCIGLKAPLRRGLCFAGQLRPSAPICLAVTDEDFNSDAPAPQPAWIAQAVPALLVAAVLGLCGLFLQVTKIETGLGTVLEDVRELKNDSKERLNDIDRRVRALEMSSRLR